MIADSLASLRQAFRGRAKPEKWLRDNLHPMDLEDGREFVDDISNGGSSEKYFLSAIPYPAFLTIEADLFLLPDFLATIVTDSSQAVTVLSHYQESGKSALGVLTEEERAAVVSFTESLMKTEEAAWMRDPLSDFIELIKTTPNQALLPTPTAVTPPAGQESRQP